MGKAAEAAKTLVHAATVAASKNADAMAALAKSRAKRDQLEKQAKEAKDRLAHFQRIHKLSYSQRTGAKAQVKRLKAKLVADEQDLADADGNMRDLKRSAKLTQTKVAR